MLKTILTNLAKQKNTSPHIGALLNVYSSTAIMYAPLTLVGVATTIYGLWGAEIIRGWFPWFTFPMLLGGMVFFILIMMVVFYKVIIPSQIAFGMQQNYKHRNPLVADVQKILRKLDKIEDRLEKLENK